MNIVKRGRQRGGPLSRLQDEMNELFGRFFEDWDWPLGAWRQGSWWPALDVAEHDDAIVVKAELPGLNPDDIEVSVHGNTLTLSGEKKESSEDKGDNYYHVERRYGRFHRDVLLPAEVDAEKVEANYKDGVLTITVPKTEEAKPKKIKITSK